MCCTEQAAAAAAALPGEDMPRIISLNTRVVGKPVAAAAVLGHDLSILPSTTTVDLYYRVWHSFPRAKCTGDLWPTEWSDDRCRVVKRHYKAIPEKFYWHSKLPVVTVWNFEEWQRHMSKVFFTWCWFA